MINFEEELKKFKPSLEIDQAEAISTIFRCRDILEDMMKEVKIASGNKRF